MSRLEVRKLEEGSSWRLTYYHLGGSQILKYKWNKTKALSKTTQMPS
jgi:hypothetical protein